MMNLKKKRLKLDILYTTMFHRFCFTCDFHMVNGAFTFFSLLRTISVGTQKWEVCGADDRAEADLRNQSCSTAQSHVRVVESPYRYQ